MKYLKALLLFASFSARVLVAVAFASAASALSSVSALVLPSALMFGVALWYSSANKVGSTDIFGRATAWAIVVVLVAALSVAEASGPLPYAAKVFILAVWGWEAWPLFITALGLYSLTVRPTLENRLEPPPTLQPPEEPPEASAPGKPTLPPVPDAPPVSGGRDPRHGGPVVIREDPENPPLVPIKPDDPRLAALLVAQPKPSSTVRPVLAGEGEGYRTREQKPGPSTWNGLPSRATAGESPDGYRPTEEPDIPAAEQPEPDGGE